MRILAGLLLAASQITLASASTVVPDVPFVLLRLDYQTNAVQHAYRFTQPYRKTLTPEGSRQISDVFLEVVEPTDFGYTDLRSRLTGQRVFRATSIWLGTGVLEWPTGAQEVAFTRGAAAGDPQVFSWSGISTYMTEAVARSIWESVRDVDLVLDVAAQGPYGVFVFDHLYDACCSGYPEYVVLIYGKPTAPTDVGIPRLVWPRTLVTRGVKTVPEVRVHNFSDAPVDLDVEVTLRSGGASVYTSRRSIAGLNADTGQVLAFDQFLPQGPTPYDLDVRLLGPGGTTWSDTFADNDVTARSISTTALPVFRLVSSLHDPGNIPLPGEMLDFDGDGDYDVIQHRTKPVFLSNDGTGHFTNTTSLVTATFPSNSGRAYARDFTGDGATDVLITFATYPVLLQGNGTGAFTEITEAAGLKTFTNVRNLEPLDLDGDGDQDILIQASATRTILLNDGAGHFSTATAGSGLDDGLSGESITAADLDADGSADLISANWNNASSVYRNLGAGVFTRQTFLGGDLFSRVAAVLDFDHDGAQDILLARDAGSRLYRQRGPYDFEDVTASAGPIGPAQFAGSADINDDGLPDLILGSSIGPPRLLVNTGGAFEDRTELLVDLNEFPRSTGTRPHQFLDFDGDGDLDLYALTLAYENLGLPPQLVGVTVDIKPGSQGNVLNPTAGGLLPVAILGSPTFDVSEIDASTWTFGTGLAPLVHQDCPHITDVNADGVLDLLGHFRVLEAGIATGDTEACVQGSTIAGTPFRGCDHLVTRSPRRRTPPRPLEP